MTITKEGALASFYTINKAPIKHLKVYFSPKQAGEGDPSPENVREISGWSNTKILHGGINIFDKNNFIDKTYFFTSTGLVETDPRSKTAIIECAPNTTYTVYKPATNKNDRFSVGCSDHICDVGETLSKAVEDLKKVDNVWKTVEHKIVFQTNSTAKYLYIRYRSGYTVDRLGYESESEVLEHILSGMQIEVGENPKSYDEYEYKPYRGQTHTIDWSNDIGTVYGGYVDLVTGELVETHKLRLITGNEGYTYYKFNAGLYTNTSIFSDSKKGENLYGCCSMQSSDASGRIQAFVKANADYGVQFNEVITLWGLEEQSSAALIAKLQEWNNAGTPLQIVYKLQIPITHQLTPTQLSTLIGRNNIWSNADRVEVEYDLAESNDELYRRRNILLRSAPHIETKTSNHGFTAAETLDHGVDIMQAQFKTDIGGYLKNTRIYFYPRQPGEYDPSPDNVRPIYGHTGLKIWNNTPLPSEYQQVEYIRGSSSKAIIDTGVAGGDDTLEFDLCFEENIHSNYRAVFGNTIGENNNSYRFIMPATATTTTYYWSANTKTGESRGVGFGQIVNASSDALGVKIHAYLNYDIGIMEINGKTRITKFSSFPRADENNTNTILINAAGNGRTPNTTEGTAKGTFYYFKIWKAGKLIRHFIPCYRKSDHEVGMYDIIEGQFYERLGKPTYGTPFEAGPDVDINGYVTEINWADSIGEVYGGYIDLEAGTLVKTHHKVIIDGREANLITSVVDVPNENRISAWTVARDAIGDDEIMLNTYLHNGMELKSNCMQNIAKIDGSYPNSYVVNSFYSISSYSRSICYSLPRTDDGVAVEATIAGVKAYLARHPFELVGRMVTPITYQLNPIQLRSLRGTNNIWSDANGPVEISYWTH